MSPRRLKKTLLYILTGIVMLVLLTLALINLPFAHRYATDRVNGIFEDARLPIHIRSIEHLRTRALSVTGVTITGVEGDTIIHADGLKAGIRVLALLKREVYLSSVILEGASIRLIIPGENRPLNIAETFTAGQDKKIKKQKEAKRSWDVSVKSLDVSGLEFELLDSVSRLFINQEVERLKVKTDPMSIREKTIILRRLEIEGANGGLRSVGKKEAEKNGSPGTWSFGLNDLYLFNIRFSMDDPGQELALQLALDEGQVRAGKTEIQNKSVDINKALFSGFTIDLRLDPQTAGAKGKDPPVSASFPWDIECKNLELENGNLGFSGYHMKQLSLKLSDLELSPESAGLDVKRLRFDLNNGFSLKETSGKLLSRGEETTLGLQMESAHSMLDLEAGANSGFPDLTGGLEGLRQGYVSLNNSRLSLRDLEYFDNDILDQPLLYALAEEPFTVTGDLKLTDSVLSLSTVSISRPSSFIITVDGEVNDSLQFGIGEINTAWLHEFLGETGIATDLPEIGHLAIEGMLTDSLISPKISLALKSDLGYIDLSASYHHGNDSLNITSGFDRINLDRVLDISGLKTFSGSGEFKGHGIRQKRITGDAILWVDSLLYQDYTYRRGEVHCRILPREFDLRFRVDDPALGLDLEADISTGTDLSVVTRGSFQARTAELNLTGDSLLVEGSLEAALHREGKGLEVNFGIPELAFTTPKDRVIAGPVNAWLRSDTAATHLSGSSAYFNLDLQVHEPLDSLKTILPAYSAYAASFMDTLVLKQTFQNPRLPGTRAHLNINYHPAFEALLQGLEFENIGMELMNSPEDEKLWLSIQSGDIRYKSFEIGRLDTRIADSSGVINLRLEADSNLIFSHPVNTLLIDSESAERQGITKLSVLDQTNALIYGAEFHTVADSSRFHVTVPSRQLTINHIPWQMASEAFLSYDYMGKRILPDMEMHSGNTGIRFSWEEDEAKNLVKCNVKDLRLESLLPENILPGNPKGELSGSLGYYRGFEENHEFDCELDIRQLNWSDLFFNKLHLKGKFKAENPEIWTLDAYSRLDTSEIRLQAEKTGEGILTLNGALTEFPINTVQPFVKEHLTELHGSVSGNLHVLSQKEIRDMHGEITISRGHARVNTLNSAFRMPEETLSFNNERIHLDNLTILDSANNRLSVSGFIDLTDPALIYTDLAVQSTDLQLMNRDRKDNEYFYGQVFVNSRINVKGPLAKPDLMGRILLTGDTEVFFRNKEDLSLSNRDKIITFISDSVSQDRTDILISETAARIQNSTVKTLVEIDPSTRINFNLSQMMYQIDLRIQGGGALNYGLLENNQMNLTGKYEIGQGTAELRITGWPNKTFRISRGAYVSWDGNVEDPILNLEAVNRINTSYTNPVDGQIRNVEFNVILKLADRLSELDMVFTVNTPDQYLMSIINTLSPEEQMRQAITTLLFESIDLPGISNSTDYVTQQVNQILASQLNELTKTTIKGIDISFGIDTYTSATSSGGEQTNTSLSYDVQKAVLNDRGKIEVSGRVNDYSNPQNMSNISLNNVSFEYQLDSSATRFVKVYNEHSYEDVFDGEVIKTGVGFLYRKSYPSLGDLLRRSQKKKSSKSSRK